jgi:RNA polymerase sigma-70 factor (ECF subfamily)
MQMSQDEIALTRKAQMGDRAAFEEIVRRTSRLLYARLFLDSGDPHQTEDLLQETLLRAFRSLGQLDRPEHLRPWLLSIAQNVLTDQARRASRKKRGPPTAGPGALASVPGHEPPPLEGAERAEQRARVLAVLRSLPEEYRLPLTLRYLGGAGYESIEAQLGVTNGSLRGFLYRGLKMLRERLGDDR